ncbi:hypothetical protein OSB04_019266 [Centaurea solstitialis]|uniref:SWIM-type domain-containing protein n=1 Tax=Centaurea solstitialis TaxID=347529 RepID=A0AA38SXL4_9ASTR|nr:hypothetical protein OSB04_019266 [Centaurea solstitialis]
MVQTLWQVRPNHESNEYIDVYGLYETFISLKINHGGFFTKSPGRSYQDGKVHYVDLVDTDVFSVHELDAMMQEIGYRQPIPTYYHFRIPGEELDFGLKALGNDQDVRNMIKHVPACRVMEIYTEHWKSKVGTYLCSPSGTNVVIEEIEETPSPELSRLRKKREVGFPSSCKKKLLLEWHAEGCDVDNQEKEKGCEVGNQEKGKACQVDVQEKEKACNDLSDEDYNALFDQFQSQGLMGGNFNPFEGLDDHLENQDQHKEVDEGDEVDKVDIDISAFNFYTDAEAEWIGRMKPVCREGSSHTDDYTVDHEDFASNTDDSDLEMERKRKLKQLRKEKEREAAESEGPPIFYVGKVFGSKDGIKQMIDTHAILTRRQIFVIKNDLMRIRAACFGSIPALNKEDNGGPSKAKKMKSHRAKAIAMNRLRGDFAEQYKGLRDYLQEVQRTNLNTTVKLEFEVEPNPESETRRFKRVYVCFGALKQGFKAGLRDFLGLDGAFMKEPFPGQILTAVGIDSNNGTYPLAHAIVEAETTSSWTWQKGIIPAIAKVFPCAEHRFCIRHIEENMKKKWRGKLYKDLLWKCAAAPTVQEFDVEMEALKKVNPSLYDWLKQIPPHNWTKSHFTGRSHTDVLLNNICEVFNKQLVDGRDKPIMTCLEYIRQYIMKRIANVQQVIDKAEGPLTPTVAKEFEKIKKNALDYSVIWNGEHRYQVSSPSGDQVIVDVKEKTCTCRTWELTGIPCKHVVATIWDMASHGEDVGIPEQWVHQTYWLDTWKQMYKFKLEPINGIKLWVKYTSPITLLPPIHHTQVGRPKKKRKKAIGEVTEAGKKLKRVGKTVTCVKCKKQGHNSRTCKGQAQ